MSFCFLVTLGGCEVLCARGHSKHISKLEQRGSFAKGFWNDGHVLHGLSYSEVK